MISSKPPSRSSSVAAQIHNLPHQATPFIGRADELVELNHLLIDPECRLLTLVGPGGAGKTRLACQIANDLAPNFQDGIYFVSLETLESSAAIPLAIADSLGIPPRGPGDPEAQLLKRLKGLDILLILDNFEHLIDGAELTIRMLEAAPNIKLLITSREVLNLREEWVFTLRGLSYPGIRTSNYPSEIDPDSRLAKYDAIQMFVERASQVRRDFSPSEEMEHIVTICQLVDGSPLALELAAAWSRTLNCQIIVREIQRSQNFLASSMRNVPDRHRSLQAIFDQSWKMLSRQEQSVFKRLSGFRGGFQYRAAEQVAAASPPILAALTGKSLVGWHSDGRYTINQLLRSYAAERLAEASDEVIQTHDLHCAYYANFLHEHLDDLLGGEQLKATREIETELENVRAAWIWAVDHGKTRAIQQSAQALDTFFQFTSRFKEGLEAMRSAAARLEKQDPSRTRDLALAEVLVCQGWLFIRLGDFSSARSTLEHSLALFSRYDDKLPPGIGTDPQIPLSLLASIQGDYDLAVKLGERALEACKGRNERPNLPVIHYVLASAWSSRGDYTRANQHAKLACQIVREDHNHWMLAYCLIAWGGIELSLGNYEQAKNNFLASYKIREEFADPEGMAVALNRLGVVELRQGHYEQSRQRFERSLALYRKLDDIGGLASTINGLAFVSTGLGDYDRASREFHQALQITFEMQYLPLLVWVLIGIGNLLCLAGRQERGLGLLRVALSHPASEREAVERAQELIDRALKDVPSDLPAEAIQIDGKTPLESVVADLLVELGRLDFSGRETGSGSRTVDQIAPTQVVAQLIDPLTDRELEVLELLAQGMANREIAETLYLSVGTVKWYTGQIYRKLQAGNRTQAVARGRELGLLN